MRLYCAGEELALDDAIFQVCQENSEAPLVLLKTLAEFSLCPNSCSHAFENVKAVLCAKPVPAAHCFNHPFQLFGNASIDGVQAVWVQTNDQWVDPTVSHFFKKFILYQLSCLLI